ncbi:MAG: hypothetical protein IKW90_16880 [Lachnospiraceae bacterium]|nr:hypothetical protein [Lachnospiraceae bacterium]
MAFDWLYFMLYDAISSLFTVINETTANIFDLPWIAAFISLFHHLGWILFVCGLIVAVFDTAIGYENGQANIKGTCLNVLKGFFAASLITVVPQRLYSFCTSLQHTFSIDLTNAMLQNTTVSVMDAATSVLDSLSADVSPSSLFFIILFGYCVIKVILANVKRGGILLCQIAVGSLYMFSVPRGYTDGFVGWCKQIIATCLTAFLQTSILYVGLISFQEHPIVAVGLCLSSTEVPRIAQMFGLDTSVKVNMMSISSTVSMGSRVIRAVGKK